MKIIYLSTNYPAVTHTFIHGEITALESLGLEIVRVALNEPGASDLKSSEGRSEAAKTYYVKATPRLIVARTCLSALVRHPLATLKGVRRTIRGGASTPRVFVVRLLQFVEALLVWRHGQTHGATVVHAHFGQAPATVAMLAATFGNDVEPDRWRWGVTIHGWHEFANEEAAQLGAKLESADLVVGISDFTLAQLMRIAPTECWPKIHLVRCGIDRAMFPSRPYHPMSRPPQIVITARLSREKGHLILLQALAQLRSTGTETMTKVIGDGPDKADIASLVAGLGLSDCVELTGSLEQSDIAEALRTADVFCLPSFAEGLPVSIMEAMAVGVPVITTYISGIPELVVDQKTGWIVPAGNARLLADAIGDVLTNPRRDEIITEAQSVIDERHLVLRSANTLLQLFGEYYFGDAGENSLPQPIGPSTTTREFVG